MAALLDSRSSALVENQRTNTMDLHADETGLKGREEVPEELADTVWYFAYRHDMAWSTLKKGHKAVAKNVWLCKFLLSLH